MTPRIAITDLGEPAGIGPDRRREEGTHKHDWPADTRSDRRNPRTHFWSAQKHSPALCN